MVHRIVLGNHPLRRLILKWMILWLGIVAVLIYGLPLVGVDYSQNYLMTAVYFLFFASFGIYHYRVRSLLHHHSRASRQFLYIAAVSSIIMLIGLVLRDHYPLSTEKVNQIKSAGFYFPLFEIQTWLVKIADITYQQVFVFILLKEMQLLIPEKKTVMQIFGWVFLFLHLPLVISLGWAGFYFIIPSTVAGLIFSYLILYRKNGIFWSYLVHLVFYFILGLLLRYRL